jgi:hypothetical protein
MRLYCYLFVTAGLTGCTSAPSTKHDAFEATFGKFDEIQLRHRVRMAAYHEIQLWLNAHGEAKSLSGVFSSLPGNPIERDKLLACWIDGKRGESFDGTRYPWLPSLDGQISLNSDWHMSSMHVEKGIIDMKSGRHTGDSRWTLLQIVNDVAEDRGFDCATINEFLSTRDKAWADEVIYWLVHLATTKPEYSASPYWRTWRSDLHYKRQTAADNSTYRTKVTLANIPEPCFKWDDSKESPSECAYTYLLYASFSSDQDLDREAALWWAVVLTLHHKSEKGAAALALFRSKHAVDPNSDFWTEAAKEIAVIHK